MPDSTNIRRFSRSRQPRPTLSPSPPHSQSSSAVSRSTTLSILSLTPTNTSSSNTQLPDALNFVNGPQEQSAEILKQSQSPIDEKRYDGTKMYQSVVEEQLPTKLGKRQKPAPILKNNVSRDSVLQDENEKTVNFEMANSNYENKPNDDQASSCKVRKVFNAKPIVRSKSESDDDEIVKEARAIYERENNFVAAMNHIDPTIVAGIDISSTNSHRKLLPSGSRRKSVPKKIFISQKPVSVSNSYDKHNHVETEKASVKASEATHQLVCKPGLVDSSKSIKIVNSKVGSAFQPVSVKPLPQPISSINSVPSSTSSIDPPAALTVSTAPTSHNDDDDDIQIIENVPASKPLHPTHRRSFPMFRNRPRPIIHQFDRFSPSVLKLSTGSNFRFSHSQNPVFPYYSEASALERGGKLIDRHYQLAFSQCTSERPMVHLVMNTATPVERVYIADSQHFKNFFRFKCINDHPNEEFIEIVPNANGEMVVYEFGLPRFSCIREVSSYAPDKVIFAVFPPITMLMFVKITHICEVTNDQRLLTVPYGPIKYQFRYTRQVAQEILYEATCGCPAKARLTEHSVWVNYAHKSSCEKFILGRNLVSYQPTPLEIPDQRGSASSSVVLPSPKPGCSFFSIPCRNTVPCLTNLAVLHKLPIELNVASAYWCGIREHIFIHCENLIPWNYDPQLIEIVLAELIVGDTRHHKELMEFYRNVFPTNYQILKIYDGINYKDFRADSPYIINMGKLNVQSVMLQFIALYSGFRLLLLLTARKKKELFGNWGNLNTPLAVIKKIDKSLTYVAGIGIK